MESREKLGLTGGVEVGERGRNGGGRRGEERRGGLVEEESASTELKMEMSLRSR